MVTELPSLQVSWGFLCSWVSGAWCFSAAQGHLLLTEVGLSSGGCEFQSPQEFPLTTNSKKEKYFISTHQSDGYNGTTFRGHIKKEK